MQPSGRKLGVYSLGFLTNRPLREALAKTGWDVVFGPTADKIDAIGVWGDRPVAARGKRAAVRRNLPLVHIEDAFLRSVTSVDHEPLMGLTIDETGNYLDASAPSDLENLLNDPVSNTSANDDLAEFLASGLSKYNEATRSADDLPDTPFVLVVDQLRDDASIRLGGADAGTFGRMLAAAIAENPGMPIYVKRHPRAASDPSRSHFQRLPDGVMFLEVGFAIADVLDRSTEVYCVTSQVGFEAILRGHRPRVFGGAFYAGWGLSRDEQQFPRRTQSHSVSSFFQRVMVEYPVWFDVYSGDPCDFGSAFRGLQARRDAFRLSHAGSVAVGMRLWKRPIVRNFLGRTRFCDDPNKASAVAQSTNARLVAWSSSEHAQNLRGPITRMEDGFLRSVGLGAELVEPVSFCFDDLGIYYDPNGESRLERLIEASRDLPDWARLRAAALRARLVEAGLSKYNVGSQEIQVPPGRRVILVPGQVEDDASILLGTGAVSRNLDLLRAARAENVDAHLIYKPHPDVEAGLRKGKVPADELARLCDQVLTGVSAAAALNVADEVWTMTSLMGFEALLRDKCVVCLGRPFYAGWGLTNDRGASFERRRHGIGLDGLVHATLIEYPSYRDPVSGYACPVEVVIERLAKGQTRRNPTHRALSKVQGLLASHSWIWR